ncbi:MAG: substrate-binding domain-containing protein [Opitutaceae bacterium]
METALLKYQTVEEKMRQLVATLPEGARLPSERMLADELGVNFLTARRGVLRLVKEGLVWRKVGSGTFVSSKTPAATPEPSNKRIGMLIAQHSDAYAHRIMQAVAGVAATQNLEISSGWISDYGPAAQRQIDFLKEQGCISVMIPWFEPSRASDVLALAKNSSLPVAHPQIMFGIGDNDSATRRARIFIQSLCSYLRHDGDDLLAYLGPDHADNGFLQQRLGAFSMHCASNDIPHAIGLVKDGSSPMNQLAERWATHKGRLSVLAYDDDHALRFMTAMHRLGLCAPSDYRIIGFNNTDGSRFSDPPLTTVAQNYNHVAGQLVRNALDLATGKPAHYEEMQDMPLIVRESCQGRSFLTEDPSLRFPGLAWRIESTPTPAALAPA